MTPDRTGAQFGGADITDTGAWKLIILVEETGMQACLRSTEDKTLAPVALFRKQWNHDATPLLEKIESYIYDNPRLLDDYATDIIIQTPRCLHIPLSAIEEEGAETDLFREIYKAEPEDVLTDMNADSACVYTLTAGLPSFLQRTLPGARIRCHLSILEQKFREQTSELTRIYVDIRSGEADIICFNDTELISSATQFWSETADIAYRVMLLLNAYSLKSDEVEVRISGLSDVKSEMAPLLRKMINYVVFTPEPASVSEFGFPLAMALSAES